MIAMAQERKRRQRKCRFSPGTLFSLELTKVLISRRINNLDLHAILKERGYQASRVMVDRFVKGMSVPSGAVVEQMGMGLGLPEDRIMRWHRACALDLGYKVCPGGRLDG